MKFTGQQSTSAGKERYLVCNCEHVQTDYTDRPVDEIRCNRCGMKAHKDMSEK